VSGRIRGKCAGGWERRIENLEPHFALRTSSPPAQRPAPFCACRLRGTKSPQRDSMPAAGPTSRSQTGALWRRRSIAPCFARSPIASVKAVRRPARVCGPLGSWEVPAAAVGGDGTFARQAEATQASDERRPLALRQFKRGRRPRPSPESRVGRCGPARECFIALRKQSHSTRR
jgi:hypothetical protein